MSRKQNEKSMTREPIGKKLRFEVFKRDSFTCQYCGTKAPEAVLHCDHIHPVADGGKTEILNLVTACEGCNLGKGKRLLDDNSVIAKQQAQLEELQSRREQLEMMLEWRDALQREKVDLVDELSSRIAERGQFTPNESGREDLRKWVRRYGLQIVLEAIDTAFDSYAEFRGDKITTKSWNLAFKKIGAIANLKKQAEEKPYMPDLAYVQGILRRRFEDKYGNYINAIEEIHLAGMSIDNLKVMAKVAKNWDDFCVFASTYPTGKADES